MHCLEHWLITLADHQLQCQHQNTDLGFILFLVLLCTTQNLRKKFPEKYEALMQKKLKQVNGCYKYYRDMKDCFFISC